MAYYFLRSSQHGETTIYFTAGFKSYDITKIITRNEVWFEWVERSRNFMWRVIYSSKVSQWIPDTLNLTSKVRGETVIGWKMKDHFTDIFCTLKNNRYGRYISIAALHGKHKSVLIIPETSFNAG